MTELAALETPVPLVDLDRLERNIATMADYARRHGLGLRPHTKTHKALTVARAQVAHGAIGLTCATTRESEVMAEASHDLLVAHPPVGVKAEWLMRLDPAVTLTVALDSDESLGVLAAAARRHDRPVRVLIELDLGMRRVGVTGIEEAIRLATLVRAQAPLVYAGIMFYPGQIRQQPGEERDAHLARLDATLLQRRGEMQRIGRGAEQAICACEPEGVDETVGHVDANRDARAHRFEGIRIGGRHHEGGHHHRHDRIRTEARGPERT